MGHKLYENFKITLFFVRKWQKTKKKRAVAADIFLQCPAFSTAKLYREIVH